MEIPKKKTDFNQGAYIQDFMKRHYRRITLLLHLEADADVIARLDNQPNKNAYLKKLIREDMKK